MKNAKHIVKTVLFCGTLAVFSAVSVLSPKEKAHFTKTAGWRSFRCRALRPC